MANCCLCHQPVSEERRRSKKLYGPGCASVRADLERISLLCCNCKKKFTTVKSLEANLVVARDEVFALLDLSTLSLGGMQPTTWL